MNLLLATADSFTGQYRDATAFMAALADRLTLEARARWNRPGAVIEHVMWTDELAGQPLDHPIAAVTISPGDEPLTVVRLREHFKAERERARPTAEQGRLI